jgi:hypothetical protein
MYQVRFDQTMNQKLEEIKSREEKFDTVLQNNAMTYAQRVLSDIKQGETMPFYLAYDHAGLNMAEKFNITEKTAKSLIKQTYQNETGADFYTVGKALEAEHHTPKREAERQRQASVQTRSNYRQRSQTM